jgi:glycosyltransferase involved in cell wall biosynthesis
MLDSPLVAALFSGGLSIVLEVIGLSSRRKYLRIFVYGGALILMSFAAAMALTIYLHLATVLLAIVAIYRGINDIRVLSGRIKEPRLYFETRRSSLRLLFLQITTFILCWLSIQLGWTALTIIYSLTAAAFLVALLLTYTTVRNLRRMSVHTSDKYTSDSDLPTVSVCIPARNETEDLPSCLSSILRSDYPKLEILVLDDCSQDQTSEIIKGFAQDGVRFIKGEEPTGSWLARNHALQTLAESASGELLLFCGVDARLDKGAIRALVGSMMARNKQMISLLPQGVRPQAGFVRPMLLWWELALPRRQFNRPPVLSDFWIITRQAFFAKGELKTVKNSVLPEGYFARELTRSDEYSFMRSSGKLLVTSTKSLSEQWETAVRIRYPRLRYRPENVLIVSLAEAWFIGLPLGLFILGYIVNLGTLFLLAGTTALLLFYVHFRILQAWLGQGASQLIALSPITLITDLFLLHYSLYRYEFSTIKWKDRNICIPVMRHINRLPRV